MRYNIVTNYTINSLIKQKSKHYKVGLGQSITLEDRSGERIMNARDQFAFVYNQYYKSSVLKQGSVGDIDFYTDHLILDNKFRLYIDREEFIYDFDEKKVLENGIDSYLGYILKISQESFDEIIEEKIKDNSEKRGNADNILKSPGAVRYEDLKEYLNTKNSQRLK
jgi:hypothetical protein